MHEIATSRMRCEKDECSFRGLFEFWAANGSSSASGNFSQKKWKKHLKRSINLLWMEITGMYKVFEEEQGWGT